ncbi:MAG: shikimate kinase [Candidatus Harrisonbacteria bacterium]|nr:shikimate kinase [Candidatus Harrisonbacteria bacterium]
MKGVTLIGMPGSGKSTVGKLLASRLNLNFVDLDLLIKEKTGKTHQEILEKSGDKELLKLEEQYTLQLNFANTVFSPGGSIIYSPAAMAKLIRETNIFYLNLPLEEIKKRLGENIDYRGIVGLKEKGIEGLFEERVPAYQSCAHYTLDCHGFDEKRIAEGILWLLN